MTSATLTRAAGAAAFAAGVVLMAVQIGHPELKSNSIQTTNVEVRDSFKVLVCALALAGREGVSPSQFWFAGMCHAPAGGSGTYGLAIFSHGPTPRPKEGPQRRSSEQDSWSGTIFL